MPGAVLFHEGASMARGSGWASSTASCGGMKGTSRSRAKWGRALPSPSQSRCARTEKAPPKPAPVQTISEPLRVLVVEDEPLVREVVSVYLHEDGHSVETAGNGREGLEKFKGGAFDVVLTDRAMPEMNGDQLAAQIKLLNPGHARHPPDRIRRPDDGRRRAAGGGRPGGRQAIHAALVAGSDLEDRETSQTARPGGEVEPPLPSPTDVRPSSERKFSVLLVEADPVDARLLDATVEASRSAFKVEWIVETLAEGLQVLDSCEVDVILLDLALPDSFGIDTFKAARAHSRRLPIIVLSGSDDEELAIYTMHEGAQDYLVKGQIDSRLLLRAMRYAVERHRVEEAFANERNLLRNLLDNLPDYIYAKDADGRYVIDNRAHMQLFADRQARGHRREDGVRLFPEGGRRRFHADDQDIISSGNALVNREEPSVTPHGEPAVDIDAEGLPLKNRQNKPTGLVCIGRDITAQRIAQEQLKQANADLSKSRKNC